MYRDDFLVERSFVVMARLSFYPYGGRGTLKRVVLPEYRGTFARIPSVLFAADAVYLHKSSLINAV